MQLNIEVDSFRIETTSSSRRYSVCRNPSCNSISINMYAGDLIHLYGNNGIGKTSFLHCLSGIYDSRYTGNILIHGIDALHISSMEFASYISILLQENYVYQSCKVVDIFDTCYYSSRNVCCTEKNISALINIFSIEYLMNKRFNQLSKGEKQIIYICIALAKNVHIYILDEPISNIDTNKTYILCDLIQRYIKKNSTFIISSSNINEYNRLLEFNKDIHFM